MANQSKPFTDSDFSLLFDGVSKDDKRRPSFGITFGEKRPTLVGMFMTTDGKKFSQPLDNFKDYYRLMGIIDHIANFPGEGKVQTSMRIMSDRRDGPIPTGTTLIVSRRNDGVITLRIENKNIRDAIFPIRMGKTLETEIRVESGEPQDPRWLYRLDALEYTQMMRGRAAVFLSDATAAGKQQQREEMSGGGSWG